MLVPAAAFGGHDAPGAAVVASAATDGRSAAGRSRPPAPVPGCGEPCASCTMSTTKTTSGVGVQRWTVRRCPNGSATGRTRAMPMAACSAAWQRNGLLKNGIEFWRSCLAAGTSRPHRLCGVGVSWVVERAVIPHCAARIAAQVSGHHRRHAHRAHGDLAPRPGRLDVHTQDGDVGLDRAWVTYPR